MRDHRRCPGCGKHRPWNGGRWFCPKRDGARIPSGPLGDRWGAKPGECGHGFVMLCHVCSRRVIDDRDHGPTNAAILAPFVPSLHFDFVDAERLEACASAADERGDLCGGALYRALSAHLFGALFDHEPWRRDDPLGEWTRAGWRGGWKGTGA